MKEALVLLVLAASAAAADPIDDYNSDADRMHREFEADRARDQEGFRNTSIVLFGAFAAIVVVGGLLAATRRDGIGPTIDDVPEPARADTADVSVLRIAIDARAAKFVRSELARIDQLADATTPGGRLTRLREIGVMLRRMRDAWVYGGAVNEPMRAIPESMAVFRKHADDARTRLTRNVAPDVGPQDRSLILISIVVVAKGELANVSAIGAGEELRRALEAAAYRAPDELLALDVIVVPAEDQTLSSLRLAALYPQPELFPIQGALVGKTFCTYCGGPFPAELVTCPHCGAPAPGRDRATG